MRVGCDAPPGSPFGLWSRAPTPSAAWRGIACDVAELKGEAFCARHQRLSLIKLLRARPDEGGVDAVYPGITLALRQKSERMTSVRF